MDVIIFGIKDLDDETVEKSFGFLNLKGLNPGYRVLLYSDNSIQPIDKEQFYEIFRAGAA